MSSESQEWLKEFATREAGHRATAEDYARLEEHIKSECLRIQAAWSEKDEYRRRTGLPQSERQHLTVPIVSVADIATAVG